MNALLDFVNAQPHRGWQAWMRGTGAAAHVLRASGGALWRFTVGPGGLRVRCLLLGHEDGFAREPGRLFLRCSECGRSTHGWVVGTSPPRDVPVGGRVRRVGSVDRGRSPGGLRVVR